MTSGWRLWTASYDESGKRHLVPPLTSQAGPETVRLRGGPFKPPAWVGDKVAVAQCYRCSNPPAPDHGCGIYFYPDKATFQDCLRGIAADPHNAVTPLATTIASYGRALGPSLPDPFEPLASEVMRCWAFEIIHSWWPGKDG